MPPDVQVLQGSLLVSVSSIVCARPAQGTASKPRKARPMTLTPSQKLIVQTHERLSASGVKVNHEGGAPGSWPETVNNDEHQYTAVDHATAAVCGVTVETVGEALVAAGKRPPVWWIG